MVRYFRFSMVTAAIHCPVAQMKIYRHGHSSARHERFAAGHVDVFSSCLIPEARTPALNTILLIYLMVLTCAIQ